MVNRDDGDYLLFEQASAEGELVAKKQLKTFIQKNKAEFDFVFVAACTSELIGKIFKEAGAKHVISV